MKNDDDRKFYCRFCGYHSWRQWHGCPACGSSVPLKERKVT